MQKHFLPHLGLLLCLTIPAAALSDDEKEEARKLREAKDVLEKAAKDLKILTGASFAAALRRPGTLWSQVARDLNTVRGRVAGAEKAVGKLVRLEDEIEARDMAKQISKEYADLEKRGQGYRPRLEKLKQAVAKLKVGLVGEKSSPKFRVSLDLLLDNRTEALARLKKYALAMRENTRQLAARKEMLQSLDNRGKRAQAGLRILGDSLVEVHRKGGSVFGDLLLLQAVDAYELSALCGATAAEARRKLKEIDRVLPVERRHFDNLRANLKTLWGVSF